MQEHYDVAQKWIINSNYIVVLNCENEEHLQEIKNIGIINGLIFSEFVEPDLNNQLTVLVFEPGKLSKKLFRHLPLALAQT